MNQLQPCLQSAVGDAGPIYDLIQSVMCHAPPAANRGAQVDAMAQALVAAGLPASDIPFVKRMPIDRRAIARDCVADLARRGIIRNASVDDAALDALELDAAGYDHGGRRTFIYPEEGRLWLRSCTACIRGARLFSALTMAIGRVSPGTDCARPAGERCSSIRTPT